MPQPASLTKEQFYTTFKQHLSDGNEEAVSFANEAAERYHGLNRKLTPEEIAALYIEKNPGRISLSDVPEAQLKQALSGLGAASGGQAPPKRTDTPGPPEKPQESGGFLKKATTPLAEGQREGIKKAAGSYSVASTPGLAATAVGSAFGKGKETALFVQGFGRGLGDLGVDLTSPMNIGITAASMFGGAAMKGLSKLPKLARAASLLIKGGHAAFTVEMLKDLGEEVPAVKAAIDKKDYQAAGEAAAKAMGEVTLIGGSFREKGGVKGKPVTGGVEAAAEPPSRVLSRETAEVGGKTKEIRTRDNPKLRQDISKERTLMTREEVVQELGNLQDQLNEASTPDEKRAVEGRIAALAKEARRTILSSQFQGESERQAKSQTRPRPSSNRPSASTPPLGLPEPPPNPLDPAIAAKADLAQIDQAKATAAAEKAKIQDSEGYNGYRAGPPTERQEVIPTTEARRLQRQAEANLRAKTPTVTPGLGQRIAPEEVGEFPAQAPPRSRPVGVPKPGAKPEAKPEAKPGAKPEAKTPAAVPDGGGPLRPGVERQFIVKRKFFGVPEGSRIAIIEDPKTGQQTVSLVDESGNKKPIQLPIRSAVGTLVGKGWVEPARPLPASNVGRAPAAPMELPGPKPAPAAAPQPVAATPPKPAPVAVAPPAEVKPPIERKAPPPRKPAAKPTAAKSSPVDLASLMAERDELLAARAKLEAGSAPPEAPAKPAASPKPAAKDPTPAPPPEPVKAAAQAPAAAPRNLAQVTGAVQHIIDTQITPTRKGKTGWARVEVQPINEDFRPVGEPVTMDAKDFTPEKIAALAGQHPEARGIRVGSDPPLKTEGTISRKFDSFEAGPPKDPSSAKSGGSAPTAPTWESMGTDKQRAFARAALEMDPETASPSEEDIQFTVDTMGGLAKTEGLRQALTGYGLNQKQILAILFGKE